MCVARCAGSPIRRNWKNVSSAGRALSRSLPHRPMIPRSSNPGKSRSSGKLPNWKRSISAEELPSAPAKLPPRKTPRNWNGRCHPGCGPCARGNVQLQARPWQHPLRRRVSRLFPRLPPLQILPKVCQTGFRASTRLPPKMKKSPIGWPACAAASQSNPRPLQLPKRNCLPG